MIAELTLSFDAYAAIGVCDACAELTRRVGDRFEEAGTVSGSRPELSVASFEQWAARCTQAENVTV